LIVTLGTFQTAMVELSKHTALGLDTETTGLRMYHGDTIFSLILATPKEAYYFNFKEYDKEGAPFLNDYHWMQLRYFFEDPERTWYIQNAANFDLPMLMASERIELEGRVHCTKAIGRVVQNDLVDYSLAAQLEHIGLQKDMSVDAYIMEHKLYTVFKRPGRVQSEKLKHFDRVPFSRIAPYGEKDGTGVIVLGLHQEKEIKRMDEEFPISPGRSLRAVMGNEVRLQKTIFRMKHVGVQIDTGYCEKAIKYEEDRAEKAANAFRSETGESYSASPLLFKRVFASEASSWGRTEKGNPSFDADTFHKLKHPAAKEVLKLRDAKSKADFYRGFLFHADNRGVLHPNYNPEGTIHGRFSSSDPNFQNLTAEDDEESLAGEFVVRRAIIPRAGYTLIMPDYDQMEYKFALELGCQVVEELTEMGRLINGGFDFHEATAKRVLEVSGLSIPRKTAKISNFLTLYGGGSGKLSQSLGVPLAEARKIREAIFGAMPEIKEYIDTIMQVAEERKFIVNWLGRRCYFAYKSESYKAPNYHISGGCADMVKLAMNQIDEYLLDKKSRLIMTVHDELPIEIHESELHEVPARVKAIMEGVYMAQYIPLTCGMEWSEKSLADKVKGFPA
jgi:DNA polymerase I-like protein with 3'-5' exonuclease and polymerase domains